MREDCYLIARTVADGAGWRHLVLHLVHRRIVFRRAGAINAATHLNDGIDNAAG